MGFDLERHHEKVLSNLHVVVREEVWRRMGIDAPFDHEAAQEWWQARNSDPETWLPPAGDRVRLYLPEYLAKVDPDWRGGPGGFGSSWFDTYAGVYLSESPDEIGWRWVLEGIAPRAKRLLAFIAIAARRVMYVTGCSGAEATGWLLCGDAIPVRAMTAHFGFDAGVRLWVADWQINAEDLAKLYVQKRLWQTKAEQRSRRPTQKTAELIEYVERVRPYKGRHPDNLTWPQVLEEWNNAYPEWAYETADSIERSYKATRKRREERRLLPPRGAGE